MTMVANFPLMSSPPVANWPPVSLYTGGQFSQLYRCCCWYRWQIDTGVSNTGGNFAACVNDTDDKLPPSIYDTGIKFANRWQIVESISDYLHKKVNLKEKMYLNVTLTTLRCPNKIIKLFWLKIFSICHWCQRHWWFTLSCKYLRGFSKKIETALMWYSGAWGRLFYEKNLKLKIFRHCSFKVRKESI